MCVRVHLADTLQQPGIFNIGDDFLVIGSIHRSDTARSRPCALVTIFCDDHPARSFETGAPQIVFKVARTLKIDYSLKPCARHQRLTGI